MYLGKKVSTILKQQLLLKFFFKNSNNMAGTYAVWKRIINQRQLGNCKWKRTAKWTILDSYCMQHTKVFTTSFWCLYNHCRRSCCNRGVFKTSTHTTCMQHCVRRLRRPLEMHQKQKFLKTDNLTFFNPNTTPLPRMEWTAGFVPQR